MTKTAKNKEILQQLHDLVTKTAGAPKPVATGVPGKEPDSAAVSTKHDTVNQNAVGPENNGPQKHDQKPSTDPAKPTGGKKAEDETATAKEAATAEVSASTEKTEKAAEEAPVVETNASVEKLGRDILDMIQKFANNPVATGIPGKEPASGAVSEKHDSVDQNSVKPENNNPQSHGQKPATDPAVPVATAKSAEEAEKAASYELGRLWGELVLKQAYDQQLEQIKEAGRRDFEVLVAQAAEQMKSASKQTEKTAAAVVETEKQAEAEGAAAFQNLYKQAQIEQALGQIVAQNEALAAKVAAFEKEAAAKEAEHKAALAAKQAEIDRREAEEREQLKFAQLASVIENRIIDRMRTEVLNGK